MGVLPDWMLRDHVAITPFAENEPREGKISYGLSSYGYDARLGYKFKVFKNTSCGVIDPKKFDPNAFEEKDLTPKTHDFRDWQDSNKHRRYKCVNCGEVVDLVGEARSNMCPVLEFILIPPNSFVLGETLETFTIPRDCIAVCLGKSTYARCGIIVNVTPLEPEWTGKVTVEISNTAPLPAKVYAGEGVMQVLFLRTDGEHDLTRKVLHYYLDKISQVMGGALAAYAYAAHAFDQLRVGVRQTTCQVSYADKKGIYQSQTGVTPPKVR
jgi:dCTP deaminase